MNSLAAALLSIMVNAAFLWALAQQLAWRM
jgi:hypothetical protein